MNQSSMEKKPWEFMTCEKLQIEIPPIIEGYFKTIKKNGGKITNRSKRLQFHLNRPLIYHV